MPLSTDFQKFLVMKEADIRQLRPDANINPKQYDLNFIVHVGFLCFVDSALPQKVQEAALDSLRQVLIDYIEDQHTKKSLERAQYERELEDANSNTVSQENSDTVRQKRIQASKIRIQAAKIRIANRKIQKCDTELTQLNTTSKISALTQLDLNNPSEETEAAFLDALETVPTTDTVYPTHKRIVANAILETKTMSGMTEVFSTLETQAKLTMQQALELVGYEHLHALVTLAKSANNPLDTLNLKEAIEYLQPNSDDTTLTSKSPWALASHILLMQTLARVTQYKSPKGWFSSSKKASAIEAEVAYAQWLLQLLELDESNPAKIHQHFTHLPENNTEFKKQLLAAPRGEHFKLLTFLKNIIATLSRAAKSFGLSTHTSSDVATLQRIAQTLNKYLQTVQEQPILQTTAAATSSQPPALPSPSPKLNDTPPPIPTEPSPKLNNATPPVPSTPTPPDGTPSPLTTEAPEMKSPKSQSTQGLSAKSQTQPSVPPDFTPTQNRGFRLPGLAPAASKGKQATPPAQPPSPKKAASPINPASIPAAAAPGAKTEASRLPSSIPLAPALLKPIPYHLTKSSLKSTPETASASSTSTAPSPAPAQATRQPAVAVRFGLSTAQLNKNQLRKAGNRSNAKKNQTQLERVRAILDELKTESEKLPPTPKARFAKLKIQNNFFTPIEQLAAKINFQTTPAQAQDYVQQAEQLGTRAQTLIDTTLAKAPDASSEAPPSTIALS